MSREEVQKLLGGYATGTLTEEEQQALFAAALEDQDLFEALAKEQSLRDLLRDPAAKGAVLAALDGHGSRGIWGWLKRPWVAGLAMAGLAVVGVALWWQLQRQSGPSSYIAVNRPPAPAISAPPVQDKPVLDKVEPSAPSRPRTADQAPADQVQRQEPVAEKAERRDLKVLASPPPQAAAPPAGAEKKDIAAGAPVVAQAKPAENSPLQQAQQNAAAPPPAPFSQNSNGQLTNSQAVPAEAFVPPAQDARALFYGGQAAVNGRTFTAGTGGARAAAAETATGALRQKKAEAQSDKLAAVAFAAHPGVRCSILRGDAEVDLSTPLSPGESVKLRITPNADGFLYVMESGAIVASGPARRMQPFETPVLKNDTAGARQFRVVLSQAAISAGAAGTIGGLAKQNLVETAAEREQATYMVLDSRAPVQPFAATITLTWK